MPSDIEYETDDDTTWKIVCVLTQTIRDLDLQGTVAGDKIEAKVYPRMFPEEDGVIFPCVFVMPESDAWGVSTSKTEAWVETIDVVLVDVIGERIHQRQRVLLKWRRAIRNAISTNKEIKDALSTALGPVKVWNTEARDGGRFFDSRPDMPRHVFVRIPVKVFTTRP